MHTSSHMHTLSCNYISPVVHHKDHNLCDSDKEVSEVRDCVVFIVHSREVHHVQTLNVLVKVVQEWDRGAAGLSSANRDLEAKYDCDYRYY